MNEQVTKTATETDQPTDEYHFPGDDLSRAAALLGALKLPFIPLEAPDINDDDARAIYTLIREIEKAIAAGAAEFKKMINDPYTAGYRKGAAAADREYRRGYREGVAATAAEDARAAIGAFPELRKHLNGGEQAHEN